jgi:DNA-binding transcriptional LysR family regulator
MELRHLRYFVAVAEEGSVTRAAARLGLQQPPLSQQIRALEAELGVTLFERTARSLRLNAAGEAFLQDARRLLAAAGDAARRLQRMARGEQGRLLLGFTGSASLHPLLPRLIGRFRAAHPLVTLATQENTTRDLLQAVDEQRLDLAFVRSSVVRYPALRAICVHEEPMLVAMPKTHRLAAAPDALIALGDLAGEDFVSYRRADGPGIQDALTAACHRAGFNAHIVEEVPRLLTAITMVATGLGIAVVPEAMRAIHADSVTYRRLAAGSAITVPLNLAYAPQHLGQPARLFLAAAGGDSVPPVPSG